MTTLKNPHHVPDPVGFIAEHLDSALEHLHRVPNDPDGEIEQARMHLHQARSVINTTNQETKP